MLKNYNTRDRWLIALCGAFLIIIFILVFMAIRIGLMYFSI